VSRNTSHNHPKITVLRHSLSDLQLFLTDNKMQYCKFSQSQCGVVLYGCETWSQTLREKPRLRVFENRVSRRKFGSKKDEVTGNWRKHHNEELHYLYCSPTTLRVIELRWIRWAGHAARIGRGEACRAFWWGNLRERGHWGDPGVDRRILDGSSKRGMWGMDWIWLAQDRDRWRELVNAVMNLRVSKKAGNFLTSCKPFSFSRKTLFLEVRSRNW
jgi:hypothetical protein